MNPLSAADLARMQAANVSTMPDTCVIQVYARSLDSYGAPVETFTDGSATPCGVMMPAATENRRADLTAAKIDATLRLPIGTAVSSADHIKVTHRFGVALAPALAFEVVGAVRRGPSGLRVDCQVVTP